MEADRLLIVHHWDHCDHDVTSDLSRQQALSRMQPVICSRSEVALWPLSSSPACPAAVPGGVPCGPGPQSRLT